MKILETGTLERVGEWYYEQVFGIDLCASNKYLSDAPPRIKVELHSTRVKGGKVIYLTYDGRFVWWSERDSEESHCFTDEADNLIRFHTRLSYVPKRFYVKTIEVKP